MLRQFRPQDAKACSDIVASCIRLDPSLSEKLRATLLRTETPGQMLERARLFYLVVSENDSAVQGFGGLEWNEIRVLYVAPEHQRQRVGSEILAHLQTLVPAAFFPDIFVYSSPGAVEFYRTHGFRPNGDYSFAIEGESLPTIFMSRPLA
jgi:GNAT superfamily N-acetyltransferase